MQSLECMTAFVRAATGDVPPPLVGPSTTFAPPNHVYLFGGRTVSTRQVTASLYVLDLRTLVWTQIKPPSVHQPSTSTAADDDTPSRHITSTPEKETAPVWPSPRYFHTADTWQEKLIIFGGMGILPVDSTCFPSTATPTAASSRPPDQPCVLADLWILDLATLAWSYHPADPSSSGFPSSSDPIPFLTQHDRTALPLPVPVARYAHLSAVVADRLVVIGGQDLSNTYIQQRATFHLPSLRWESAHQLPREEIRGSYRSVAVSCSQWEEVRPSSPAAEGGGTVGKGLTFSRPRRSTFNEPSPSPSPSSPPSEDHAHAHAHDQDHVLAPHGDIYLFSNSNFTDVQRELYSITVVDPETTTTTDLTPYLAPGVPHTAPAAAQPPGLRFPFATQISHHLILGGTYLSQSTAQFAVWALNLVTWEWTKIDAQVLEGSGEKVVRAGEAADASSQLAGGVSEAGLSGGSWNRAVYWPRDLQAAEKEAENKTDKEQLGGQLLVFGNRYRNLQDDYEHRAINFDHVAIIELEVFGIYQPPLEHPVLRRLASTDAGGRWGPPNDARSARAGHALGLLHQEYLADFNVVCEDGRIIRCSSRLLEARWTWFRESRQRHRQDMTRMKRGSSTLYISESFPIVQAFLEYLYTLDLVTSLQHRAPILSGLLMLAKQYQINHLERLVVHAMHTRLDETTALGIYEVATLCECRELQVRALKLVLAMQKRAGRVPHHRRQQSSGPAAVMTAGGGGGGGTLLPAATGGAPASEGDSARTVNGSTAGGSKEGDHHTYSIGGGGYALVEREEGGSEKPNMPSTAPPSATSPGKRRRMTSTASRSFSNTSDSETGTDGQVAATGGQARCMNASNGNAADSITDDLAAEVDEYSPPTYRTRRRSDSVASLHHFTNTRHEPIPHGLLVHRRAEPVPPHPPKPASRTSLDDGHRKRNQHRTRKMASMSSLFSFPRLYTPSTNPPPPSGPTAARKLQIGVTWLDTHVAAPDTRRKQPLSPATDNDEPTPRGGGGMYTSDSSSSPSSPPTPTRTINQAISLFPNGTETGQHFVRSPPRPPPSSSFPVSRKAPMTMHFLPVTG